MYLKIQNSQKIHVNALKGVFQQGTAERVRKLLNKIQDQTYNDDHKHIHEELNLEIHQIKEPKGPESEYSCQYDDEIQHVIQL